ncbi:MAG TPA: PHB depolymerase family esterase [Kofleriaceae bacterium]|nr:PHB depolymerase family esterase [Kofleriaceae bacterium]
MRASVLLALLIACSGSDGGMRTKTYGGDRPAELRTPEMLTPGKQYPLVVILHGYSINGFTQFAVYGASKLLTDDKALVIAPDGTTDSAGHQFWNADPACCDMDNRNPDDVGYIGGLIEDILADWPIDRNQVYVIGHSNGGYMSYRMACERADLIAAISPLAGNAATDASVCNPSRPVSVLHLHGTLDDEVPYGTTPGAVYDVTQWAQHDGCGTSRSGTVQLDLDTLVDGAETHGETTAGCPAGIAVDLWTMEGTNHIPVFNPNAIDSIFGWLTAHKR